MGWYDAINFYSALVVSVVLIGAMTLALFFLLRKGRIDKRGFFPICVLLFLHPFFWSTTFNTPEDSQKSSALVFVLAAIILFFWALYRPTIVNDYEEG